MVNNEIKDEHNEFSLVSWVENFISDEKALETLKQRSSYITKAYGEVLSGYNEDPSKILKAVKEIKGYEGLVCERKIKFMSMCQHHFLPFYGEISIVYEPGEVLVGLGKISRLVHVFAKRLQFQENLTQQIAEEFMKSGKAKGVYVTSKANHLCMCFRGPRDPNAEVVCFHALGTLKDIEKQKQARDLINEK